MKLEALQLLCLLNIQLNFSMFAKILKIGFCIFRNNGNLCMERNNIFDKKKLQNFYILFVNLRLDLKSISNDQEKANLPKQTQEQTPNNFC